MFSETDQQSSKTAERAVCNGSPYLAERKQQELLRARYFLEVLQGEPM
jgi:hypothetical protein